MPCWCAACTAEHTCREQAKPLLERGGPLSQPVGDAAALHVLHHQVRVAGGRRAAIDQRDDVRMVQRGEHLPFQLEAPGHEGIRDGAARHFDGDVVIEVAVGARGEVDRAHAAAPEFAYEPVRANPRPDRRPLDGGGDVLGRAERRQKPRGGVVSDEQRLHLRAHVGRTRALAFQERLALDEWQVDGGLEHRVDHLPVRTAHDRASPDRWSGVPVSSR
jgi:hypothetical protein